MKELACGERWGYWWRLTRRTHGVTMAASLHWPSRQWNQWQVGVLVLDLSWGTLPVTEGD